MFYWWAACAACVRMGRKSDIFIRFTFLTKKYENFDSKYYFVSALLSLGNSSTARKCDGSIIVLFDPFPSFVLLLTVSFIFSLLLSVSYLSRLPLFLLHSALTSLARDLSTASLTSMSLNTSPLRSSRSVCCCCCCCCCC